MILGLPEQATRKGVCGSPCCVSPTSIAPGITRKRIGRDWGYFDARGQAHHRPRRDRPAERHRPAARLSRRLVLPARRTAISRRSASMTRGRKQYRYHPDFRAKQDAGKYDRCRGFRQGAAEDPARRSTRICSASGARPATRVVAAVVRLLDEREDPRRQRRQYAQRQQELWRDHPAQPPRQAQHGRAADALHRQARHRARSADHRPPPGPDRQALPGSARPAPVPICERRRRAAGRSARPTSTTISARRSGDDFTAKHFRTWGASVIAFEQIAGEGGRRAHQRRHVVEPVAEALGNTPAISRKSYVHPALIEAAKERSARSAGRHAPAPRAQIAVERRGRLDRSSSQKRSRRQRKAAAQT